MQTLFTQICDASEDVMRRSKRYSCFLRFCKILEENFVAPFSSHQNWGMNGVSPSRRAVY